MEGCTTKQAQVHIKAKVGWSPRHITLRSRTPPPVVMHVNKESRGILLKQCDALLGNKMKDCSKTYISFEHDILSIQGVNPLDDGVLLNPLLAQTWSNTVAVSDKLRGRLIKVYLLEMKDMY